jgi:predicted glutamine amidotransferase
MDEGGKGRSTACVDAGANCVHPRFHRTMCELMAISFERPVYADFSIRAFAMRDVENADGWGLGWYPDHSLAIAKEALTWRHSEYAEFLQAYAQLHSPIYIGHVRRKTVGGPPTRADTHPFSRELFGRDYCFAHNGTIVRAHEQLPVNRFMPIGDTDSEHVFCHILDQLAKRCSSRDATREPRAPGLDTSADWRWLHRTFTAINEMGKFNALLSDGRRLFCYHDADGFKGLWLREIAPNAHVEEHHLDDATMHVDFEAEPANSGVAAATVPLNDKPGWRRFHPGELVVVEAGRIVYGGERAKQMATATQRSA